MPTNTNILDTLLANLATGAATDTIMSIRDEMYEVSYTPATGLIESANN